MATELDRWSRRRFLTLTASGLAVAGLAACGLERQATPDIQEEDVEGGFAGTLLEPPMTKPDLTFTTMDGDELLFVEATEGQFSMLFFGYTNCPDVCPGILADMATAKRRLPADIVDDVTLILVTTDPARDTPEALKEYLSRVDESFVGLTGDLDVIKPTALSLGIDISEGTQLPSGGYEVNHGSYVLGFGEDRKLTVLWNQASINDLKEDLARLIAR